MLNLIMIAGLWGTLCTQTQINGQSGFVKETYDISSKGAFVYSRTWYSEKTCSAKTSVDTENGTLRIGGSLNSMFNPSAVAVDFESNGAVDLGGMGLEVNILKVARGQKGQSMRNTMLAIIGYKKL